MFCPGVSFSSPANINYIDIPFLCYYMYWYVPSDLCFSVLDQMRQHHHIVTDISRGLIVFGSRTIHLYVSGEAHIYGVEAIASFFLFFAFRSCIEYKLACVEIRTHNASGDRHCLHRYWVVINPTTIRSRRPLSVFGDGYHYSWNI